MPETVSCILCGDAPSRLVYGGVEDFRHGTRGKFSIVRCIRCGLVYTSPRPTRSEIGAFYPAEYRAHVEFDDSDVLARIRRVAVQTRWGQDISEYPFLARIIGTATKNYASLVPTHHRTGRLLDIGCGNGRFLYDFMNTGWECYGVEADVGACETAKARGIEVFAGMFDDLAFSDRSFDVVRLNHVLEHSHDPLGWLMKINRILREDGEVIIGIPDYDGLTRRVFGKYACSLDVPRHSYHFNRNTIRRILEKAGFSVTSIRYNSFHSDYPLVSAANLLRTALKLHSKVAVNIYATPLPLVSLVLDLFKMGDNLEIAASKATRDQTEYSLPHE